MVFCRLPLRVLVLFLVSLAGLSPSWLPLSLWTLLRIRGFRVFEFENSAQQQPVCYLMSQDKMHCQLSLTVCICSPCLRASFNSTTDFFRGVMTPTLLPVSVSLSLSLSVQQVQVVRAPNSCWTPRPEINEAVWGGRWVRPLLLQCRPRVDIVGPFFSTSGSA